MPADRGIHYRPRVEESATKSIRFAGRLPFSLFVLRRARGAPIFNRGVTQSPLLVPDGRQWVKRDPILVNLILGTATAIIRLSVRLG